MTGFQAQHGGPMYMGLVGMASIIFPIAGLFFAVVFKPQTVNGPARPTTVSKVLDTASIVFINSSALLVNLPFNFMNWAGFPVSKKVMIVGLSITLLADFLFVFVHMHRAAAWKWDRDPLTRGLATTGPYRLCRHPLYWCFLVYIIGMLLMTGSWLFSLALSVNLSVVVWYIGSEEELMLSHFGAQYEQYCREVNRWCICGKSATESDATELL